LSIKDFNAIRISLASPEEIRSWSYGEVTKPETINYRRLRPEKDGLFCEAIFGPTKDWQCYCGKYKKIRYRGIVCDKCGVEVTRARVRRERMGHIELASPVAHIWYTRRVPSYLGILLDISRRNLDRVLYFAQYIVTRVDEDERSRILRRLDEEHQAAVAVLRSRAGDEAESVRGIVDEALKDLRASNEARKAEAEARLEQETGTLMAAAAQMQEVLNGLRDKPATKAIVFAPTGATVVEKGEQVTAKHHDQLNEVLQVRLSDLQMELDDTVKADEQRYLAEREQLMRQHEGRLSTRDRQVETEVAELDKQYRVQRDEVAGLAVMQLLTEAEYWDAMERWGSVFDAGMGAEALYEIISRMDLKLLSTMMREEILHGRSKQRRKKATKRLRVIEALRRSENRPEWMILKTLPVIPPDLRPMVQLDGGRFATSDLNDLYRRVINRNNRLKRLLDLGAPDVIIRNEKRMLQEAVDSLIDNSRRGKAVSARGRRKLKSLSDMLKGKQGRFRRNLLGKRVDYSGRSVIVIGPQLKLHQCGLPKTMALELFRPFVMRKLVEYNYAHNVKGAKRLIEKMDPVVWEVLEEIIQDYPVLLNRAPTLHRLGIQAFEPVLVEGKAIQIHPLVCQAFNADFDGDMMAVHVPLSEKAKREARELMLSTRNLLKPASGEPIVEPQKDMVLGMYYLTMRHDGLAGEGRSFGSLEEAKLAYDLGQVHIHSPIRLYLETQYDEEGNRYLDGARERWIDSTVGRAIFNLSMPERMRFYDPGEPLDKGGVKRLVAEAIRVLGNEAAADLLDEMKRVGFTYATRSGLSIAVDDITIPKRKHEIVAAADDTVSELNRQFRRGLITDDERYARTIEVWTRVTDELTAAVKEEMPAFGSIRIMASSGATKGGFTPIRQLAGMRGLMADPSGRIIDLPIRSNFREGLTTLEYFISTHGARKGLADTALRTADAGYLTRRLVDVAQDAIINSHDCLTERHLLLRPRDGKIFDETLADRMVGRVAAKPIVDPRTGEVLVEAGAIIEMAKAVEAVEAGVKEVAARSPQLCELRYGICQQCYGQDLARGGLVSIGEAVGIIAAQSIGEPGTQLTLRTFHTGGVAMGGGGDITHGLPRVQELFEARNPKGEAILSDIDGTVSLHRDGEVLSLTVSATQVITDSYPLPKGYTASLEAGAVVDSGAVLADGPNGPILAEKGGVVDLARDQIHVRRDERQEESYVVPAGARLRVSEGDRVTSGQQMSDGSQNPYRILQILGVEATQNYLLDEIQKVYRTQGVNIHDKHIEIIVRQMLHKVRILRPGDSKMLPGDLIDKAAIDEINANINDLDGRVATYQPMLLGITKASLDTDSLLSAASFQHTINILAKAAIEGKTDRLVGLKENVILGKLIPAGTGFRVRTDADVDLLSVGDGTDLDLDLSEEALAELLEDELDLDRLLLIDEGESPLPRAALADHDGDDDIDALDADADADDLEEDDLEEDVDHDLADGLAGDLEPDDLGDDLDLAEEDDVVVDDDAESDEDDVELFGDDTVDVDDAEDDADLTPIDDED